MPSPPTSSSPSSKASSTTSASRRSIPDEATLKAACHRARATALINKEIDALVAKASEQAEQMPDVADLAGRVRALLDDEPALSWDAAVARIVATADQGGAVGS